MQIVPKSCKGGRPKNSSRISGRIIQRKVHFEIVAHEAARVYRFTKPLVLRNIRQTLEILNVK